MWFFPAPHGYILLSHMSGVWIWAPRWLHAQGCPLHWGDWAESLSFLSSFPSTSLHTRLLHQDMLSVLVTDSGLQETKGHGRRASEPCKWELMQHYCLHIFQVKARHRTAQTQCGTTTEGHEFDKQHSLGTCIPAHHKVDVTHVTRSGPRHIALFILQMYPCLRS